MPETTQDKILQAQRYRQNKEQGMTEVTDESILEEWADFTMVSAESVSNPALANMMRDFANTIIAEKTSLATGGGAPEGEVPPGAVPPGVAPPVPPEALGAVGGGVPVAPPGMMPG